MAQTKAGAIKAHKKLLNFTVKIFTLKSAEKVVKMELLGGFAKDRELARRAGRIGGLKSNRTGIKNGEGKSRRTRKKINVVASETIHAIKLRSA